MNSSDSQPSNTKQSAEPLHLHAVRRLSLRQNFSWTFAGNIIYAACQWGMLTILAKFTNTQMVGEFALALALITPIFAFANMQLRAIQATDASQQYQFGEYLALRLITTLAALVTVFVLAQLLGYPDRTVLVIVVMAMGRSVDSISDITYGLFQHQERMDKIAKAMVANGVLSVLMFGGSILITGNLLWGVLGASLSSLFVLFSYNRRVAAAIQSNIANFTETNVTSAWNQLMILKPVWSRAAILGLMRLALPLGLVMLLLSLNTSAPRLFIERYMDAEDLGIFAALSYLMVAGTTVMTALGQSASPRLSKLYEVGLLSAFIKLLAKLVSWGIAGSILAVITVLTVGERVIGLIYTPEYAVHNDVLLMLTIAAGFGFVGSSLGYGLTAARKFRVQPIVFGGSALVAVAACALLIPHFGLRGAAWAAILSSVGQCIGGGLVLINDIRHKQSVAELGYSDLTGNLSTKYERESR